MFGIVGQGWTSIVQLAGVSDTMFIMLRRQLQLTVCLFAGETCLEEVSLVMTRLNLSNNVTKHAVI